MTVFVYHSMSRWLTVFASRESAKAALDREVNFLTEGKYGWRNMGSSEDGSRVLLLPYDTSDVRRIKILFFEEKEVHP